ncbi:MAG: carboxymuconolactone decarboxylase family protein [Faecalibacillus sp.]
MNDKARTYHKKMFPDLVSQFPNTDPKFYDFWHNFMYDEVVNSDDLNELTRMMCILASCIGTQRIDEFKSMIKAAYQLGVTPVEIKEIIYQAVPYCGIASVLPFMIEANNFFKSKGIPLPLPLQSTTDASNRLEKGIEKQIEIFGKGMKDFYKSGTKGKEHIHKWLTDNCFGDFYTRTGLTTKQREMLAFCYLSALGGCEKQLKAHMDANIRLGNDQLLLIKIASQCLPFIGYPKTLNTLELIGDIKNE